MNEKSVDYENLKDSDKKANKNDRKHLGSPNNKS